MSEPKAGEIYTTGVTSYKILYAEKRHGRDGGMAIPVSGVQSLDGGGYARWIATDWPSRLLVDDPAQEFAQTQVVDIPQRSVVDLELPA